MTLEGIFGILVGATLGFAAGQIIPRHKSGWAILFSPYILALCGAAAGFAVSSMLNGARSFQSSSYVIEIGTEQKFEELLEGTNGPLLLAFSSRFCPPCRRMLPELHALADSYGGRLIVAKINTPRMPGIRDRYEVRGLPTLVLLEGRKEIARQVGYSAPSDLTELIQGNESSLSQNKQ